MAGNNHPKAGTSAPPSSSSTPTKNKRHPPPPPSSSSSDRKSRWESSSSKPPGPTNKPTLTPIPIPNPSPAHSGPPPPMGPPPPPTYGFHMLDRRTIFLADGSVRSYFALPPDYHDFPPLPPMKRKFDERERDEYARQKQQLLQYGGVGPGTGTSSPFRQEEDYRATKLMRVGEVGTRRKEEEGRVDPAVMKAFLNFVKVINENGNQRRNFLDNGKSGPLPCLACGRSSKDFPDVHSLVMHTYNSDNADSRVDHLGLHRALCALMGWNYMRPPDNSGAYQFLPADEAVANQDDLILWPPMVIIHNTNTGKGKDGRMEGLGNKAMDSKLRDLGFSSGKSKSLYSREGHLGITLIKFASGQSGLKEAIRLAEHFEKERHGRRDWARVQSMGSGRDDENNPNLVMVDGRTGERRNILYGYLGAASDLDKVDFETRKKAVIESKHQRLQPSK